VTKITKLKTEEIKKRVFERKDLINIQAAKLVLRNLDFTNLNVSGADFEKSDLSGSKFRGCILNGTEFRKALLSNCQFVQCKGRQTNYGVANLSNALFSDCDIIDANFYGANLIGANLSGSQFDFSVFGKADLRGSDLQNASFRYVNAEDANFGISGPDEQDLPQAKTNGLDISNADMYHAGISLPQIISAKGYEKSPSCLAIAAAVYADNPNYRDISRSQAYYHNALRLYEDLYKKEVALSNIENAARYIKRALDIKAATYKLDETLPSLRCLFQSDQVNLVIGTTTKTDATQELTQTLNHLQVIHQNCIEQVEQDRIPGLITEEDRILRLLSVRQGSWEILLSTGVGAAILMYTILDRCLSLWQKHWTAEKTRLEAKKLRRELTGQLPEISLPARRQEQQTIRVPGKVLLRRRGKAGDYFSEIAVTTANGVVEFLKENQLRQITSEDVESLDVIIRAVVKKGEKDVYLLERMRFLYFVE